MSGRPITVVLVVLSVCVVLVLSSCQQIKGPTDPDKQYKLAYAYYTGEGIVRNYEKAYFWALISSAQGSGGDDIAYDLEDEYLTQRQVIEIQNKALKWYAKHRE